MIVKGCGSTSTTKEDGPKVRMSVSTHSKSYEYYKTCRCGIHPSTGGFVDSLLGATFLRREKIIDDDEAIFMVKSNLFRRNFSIHSFDPSLKGCYSLK